MSDYIINDEWIHDFMVSIEELIGESIEYEGYQNPVPPLREIVRCKDCRWFTPTEYFEEERGFGLTEIICEPPDCGNPIRCATTYDSLTKKYVPIHIITEPDGFCSWAERREQ